MDEFKPEDEIKPDPNDRRSGRTRRADEFDNEPQIDVNNIEHDVLHVNDRRNSRSSQRRYNADYENEEDESDDDPHVGTAERHSSRGEYRSAKPSVPVSRQHLMMGIGILVLLLLVIGIGSALKSPSAVETGVAGRENSSGGGERTVDLTDSIKHDSRELHNTEPMRNGTQNISLPPISSTPTDAVPRPVQDVQRRIEVQGSLNNALMPPEDRSNGASLTLPTQPATVAANAGSRRQLATSDDNSRRVIGGTERKTAVIEPHKAKPALTKPLKTTPTHAKQGENAAIEKAVRAEPKITAATPTPVEANPQVTDATRTVSAVAKGTAPVGNVSAIKNAPGNHYTLQLSSSSNSANLHTWAKQEKLQNYMVYQTVRNGQPWYVLVSGVYASKEDAKHAVSSLPTGVQAKNPWAKPIHQVQSDLK